MSINGLEMTVEVPEDDAPVLLDYPEPVVVVMNSTLAERVWEIDGAVVIGPEFAGETCDDLVLDPKLKPWSQDSIMITFDARPRAKRETNLPISSQFKSHQLIYLCAGATARETMVYLKEKLPQGTGAACVRTKTGYAAEIAIPTKYLDKMHAGPWTSFRMNVTVGDPDEHGTSTLSWRPVWYSSDDFKDAGTFLNINDRTVHQFSQGSAGQVSAVVSDSQYITLSKDACRPVLFHYYQAACI